MKELLKIFFSYLLKPKHSLKDFKLVGKHVKLPNDGIIKYKENILISDYVYIGSSPYIFGDGGITIGSNVIIAPRVTILSTSHNYESSEMIPYDNTSFKKPVRIESNVWVGANVQICPGVTIGEGSVVAMGAVVTKSFPPCSVIGGNPAVLIKRRDTSQYQTLKNSERFYLKLKEEEGFSSRFI